MVDLDKTTPTELDAGQERCEYCGAVLNHAFYFCLSCATPYKSVANVVTEYIPPQLTEGELIKQKVPQVWHVFWTYAITIFVSVLASSLIDDNDLWLPSHLIFSSILITIVTAVVGFIHKTSLAVQLRRPGFNNRYAWYCILLLIPALTVNFLYHYLVSQLDGYIDIFRYKDLFELLGPIGVIIVMCVMPAITEEIAFRGLIQHWLYAALKPWRAILLASALFAALHLNVISFFYLFGVGVLLGWARHKTGSLYPSMVIHFCHNFAVVLWFWPGLINF